VSLVQAQVVSDVPIREPNPMNMRIVFEWPLQGRPLFCVIVILRILASRGLEPSTVAVPARPLIYFNSSEGAELLKTASHSQPFWQVGMSLQTEFFGECGQATAAVLLNGLGHQGLPAPVSKAYSFDGSSFKATTHYWEQTNVVNSTGCARSVHAQWKGALEQVAALIECAGAEARAVRAETTDAASFRRDLVDSFAASPTRLVSVNFDRRLLGQVGMGHHSPIGAYDAATDRVLILDVARYKYLPVWAGLDDLFVAMQKEVGPDPWGYSTPRGYIIAQMPQASQTASTRSSLRFLSSR